MVPKVVWAAILSSSPGVPEMDLVRSLLASPSPPSPGVARVSFLGAVYKYTYLLTYLLTYLQVHHVPRHAGELVPFVTARR